MVKNFKKPPKLNDWLKSKPDEIDLSKQRQALAEYLEDNELLDNPPRPTI